RITVARWKSEISHAVQRFDPASIRPRSMIDTRFTALSARDRPNRHAASYLLPCAYQRDIYHERHLFLRLDVDAEDHHFALLDRLDRRDHRRDRRYVRRIRRGVLVRPRYSRRRTDRNATLVRTADRDVQDQRELEAN